MESNELLFIDELIDIDFDSKKAISNVLEDIKQKEQNNDRNKRKNQKEKVILKNKSHFLVAFIIQQDLILC